MKDKGGVTSINFMKSIAYMIKVPLAILLRKIKRKRKERKIVMGISMNLKIFLMEIIRYLIFNRH